MIVLKSYLLATPYKTKLRVNLDNILAAQDPQAESA